MNIVELAGDVPEDGVTGTLVGVVIARTEVLLSLPLILAGEIIALDLARTDAVSLGLSRWIPFRNPLRTNDEPTEWELVTVLEGTALCVFILILASGVDSEA